MGTEYIISIYECIYEICDNGKKCQPDMSGNELRIGY